MTFQPVNSHVEVKPIETNSIIQSKDVTYEERGVVMSVSKNLIEFLEVDILGKCVYFDSWQAAKFIDSEGEARWLVPLEAIRAYEHE